MHLLAVTPPLLRYADCAVTPSHVRVSAHAWSRFGAVLTEMLQASLPQGLPLQHCRLCCRWCACGALACLPSRPEALYGTVGRQRQ